MTSLWDQFYARGLIDFEDFPADNVRKNQAIGYLENLYNNSQSVRDLFETIQNQPDGKLSINYVAGKAQGGVSAGGKGWMNYDPDYTFTPNSEGEIAYYFMEDGMLR